jgi:hypothetical protein
LEIPLSKIKAFALVPSVAGAEAIGLALVDNAATRETVRDQEVDSIKTLHAGGVHSYSLQITARNMKLCSTIMGQRISRSVTLDHGPQEKV